METITTAGDRGTTVRRRRLTTAIKESLRELAIQLSLLNHHVSGHLALNDVDLDCLDRLERAGWVARDRDPSDRRAVAIRALRSRNAELIGLYAGMNASMDEICAGYTGAELELLAGFLRRTATAGRSATDELAS